MTPPEPFSCRVGVFKNIFSKGVVHTVPSYPKDGATLKCHRTNGDENIFQPSRDLETPVSQQSMIGKANTNAAKQPVKKDGNAESRPGKEPRC